MVLTRAMKLQMKIEQLEEHSKAGWDRAQDFHNRWLETTEKLNVQKSRKCASVCGAIYQYLILDDLQ